MKKILGISLVAMMAVTTARAEIASKAYVDTNFQATSDLVKSTAGGGTGILSTSTDTQYPSAKAVYAYVDTVNTTATNAIQGVSVNATELTPDANKKIAITIAEGATNGTIAVNGSDVDVHGLGSAAYEAATAFDAAGTAANLVGNTSGWATAYGNDVDTVAEAIAAVDAKAAGSVKSVALASGTNDGTVKLTVDGVATDNIAVTGLGTAAYEAATAFDAAGTAAGLVGNTSGWATAYGNDVDTVAEAIAAVDAKAAGSVQSVVAGDGNGQIKVDGTNINVTGLDSAAYTASTAYLPAVATSSIGTDGTYVLTMKVSGDTQVLAWETITRNNP